ncbi:hypothetical protein WDU94_007179 [Cyamophila willieti]
MNPLLSVTKKVSANLTKSWFSQSLIGPNEIQTRNFSHAFGTKPTKPIPCMELVVYGLMLTGGSIAYPTYVMMNIGEWNGRNKAVRKREAEKEAARRDKLGA